MEVKSRERSKKRTTSQKQSTATSKKDLGSCIRSSTCSERGVRASGCFGCRHAIKKGNPCAGKLKAVQRMAATALDSIAARITCRGGDGMCRRLNKKE